MGRANFLDAVPVSWDTYLLAKPWGCPREVMGHGLRAVLRLDTSQKQDSVSRGIEKTEPQYLRFRGNDESRFIGKLALRRHQHHWYQ